MVIGLPVSTIRSVTRLHPYIRNPGGQIITNSQLSLSMASHHSIPSDGVSIVEWSVDGAIFYMDDMEVGANEEIDENPIVCDYEVYPASSMMAQLCMVRTMNDKRIAEEKRKVEEMMNMVEMEKKNKEKNLNEGDAECDDKKKASREVKSKKTKHRKRSVQKDTEDTNELKMVNNEIFPAKKSRKSEANPPLKFSIKRRKGSDDLIFVPIISID